VYDRTKDDERPKKVSTAKYPHSKEVFGWFPSIEPSWKENTTELKHTEMLYVRGEAAVIGIIKFCLKYEHMEFFPKWRKPSSLERNWPEILDFAKRNGL